MDATKFIASASDSASAAFAKLSPPAAVVGTSLVTQLPTILTVVTIIYVVAQTLALALSQYWKWRDRKSKE